jgi:hypothetical protein
VKRLNEIEYKRLSAPVDLKAEREQLSQERRNAADAMRLYLNLHAVLTAAVADRDRNAYRRTLRAFRKAARRLESRYNALTPSPRLPLGDIHTAPAMPRPTRQQPDADKLAA